MNFFKSTREVRQGWKSQYFRRSFILILIIASIPGILTGAGIYWFGVGEVEEELREIHASQISQRAQNIDNQFNNLEETLSYWAFEPLLSAALLDVDFAKDFQQTRDIMKRILILEGSHPLIGDVELYLNTPKTIVFTPYHNIIENDEDKAYYNAILEKERTVSWSQLSNGQKGDILALTHHIPAASQNPFGSVIVKVDHQEIARMLETLTPYNEGAALLLNEDKEVLFSSGPSLSVSFVSALKEEAIQQQEERDSFSMKWEGKTYTVSHGKLNRVSEEWMYVSAAPITSITSPIIFISKLILIASFSFLILAFIMAWVASAKIYSPVKNLLQTLAVEDSGRKSERNKDEFEMIEENWNRLTLESKRLQKRLTDQIPQLKQSFLLQLREGYLYSYTENELRLRMENYGWRLNNNQFLLLDVQLTGVYESDKTNNTSDESLLTFTTANILEEYAEDYFSQFTIINYHDLSVGMLIVIPKQEDLQEGLNDFAQQVASTINEMIGTSVTVTISEEADQVKQISHLFEEVSLGKRYRNFEDQNQIINLKDVAYDSSLHKISYPFETEKEVIQAVRRGQIKETEKLIRQFTNELKEKGIKEINIQPGIVQLFSSIQHEILHSGIHPNELFEGRNMFEELSQIRDLEWMVNWIMEEVITPYVRLVEGRMNIEMKELVETIAAYIDKHYMEDISLDSCAEEVNTNPYTLSKSFKKILGINFIDYLTKVRIDKAKELLEYTDLKISEISEIVGYRHSYFNRIFKKQIGVPPSQYRKMKVSI